MKRERVWVNDTSKLESLGFTHYPATKYGGEYWGYHGIRVDKKGFVCVFSVKVAAIMKLVELGKLGLIEQRIQSALPKIQVTMTDDEYSDFKKWKESRNE